MLNNILLNVNTFPLNSNKIKLIEYIYKRCIIFFFITKEQKRRENTAAFFLFDFY